MSILVLDPPTNARRITLRGQTIIPLGTTEHDWQCLLVERADGVTALVHDGFTRHEGRPCETHEAAAADLISLVRNLEHAAVVAKTIATAGSN